MKFSQTTITIEHYKESVVTFGQACCPNCGFNGERRFDSNGFHEKALVTQQESERTNSNFSEAKSVKDSF